MKISSLILGITLIVIGSICDIKAQGANTGSVMSQRCQELEKLISNSSSGFKNVRFNEKATGADSYIYNTNLQFAEFQKPAILIGDIPLYGGKLVKAAFYQAFIAVSDLDSAKTKYFAALVDTRSCLQNEPWDNTTPSGYISFNKFLVKDKVNNSEVTISLALLKRAENSYYLMLNVVSDKSTQTTGANQNQVGNSTSSQSNIPSKTIDVCQFVKILSESAKNDFNSLIGEEIAKASNDDFSIEKKYKAKISFSDFENPQIQKSIYKNTGNYYTAKMTFEESRMIPFVMNQTINSIKGCSNLGLKPDSNSSKELYDFRIENQLHSDGFRYVYLVRLQWGEAFVSNSRNLYFKLIPIRQN